MPSLARNRRKLWLLSLALPLALAFALYRHQTAAPPSEPPAPPPPDSPIRFVEMAKQAGLDYHWQIRSHPSTILDGVGEGCAFLDYDNDGNLDILLVGLHPKLYKGDGKGHFTDVTHETGLDKLPAAEYEGCAVGDYDNAGYPDIYLSGYRTGVLLHNEGASLTQRRRDAERGEEGKADPTPNTQHLTPTRVFRDVTHEMGLKAQSWGTSCAFVDMDGDGWLDLYVCNYVDYTRGQKDYCNVFNHKATCGPLDYKPLQGVVYHNRQGKGFEDITKRWFKDGQNGNGLGVTCADYDWSGKVSLAVANDLKPHDLQHRGKGLIWNNVATMAGVRGNFTGTAHAGMGIDWGDYDNDGYFDLFVTTFQYEPRSLYRNNGDGTFYDAAVGTGIMQACVNYLGFGTKFVDCDNDGWLDILIANGHVQDNIGEIDARVPYRQTGQILRNVAADPASGINAMTGNGRKFLDVSATAGLQRIAPILGRGLAVGDFDNDGRIDALIVDADGGPQLLHNESRPAGHWLLCKLVGVKCNRDAIGAKVLFDFGGKKVLRRCGPDGSYLSSSDIRVHVGLGEQTQANITVIWPDGSKNIYNNITADRILTLRQGESQPR